MKDNKDIKFEVVSYIGVLSDKSKGWRRELNRVSWYGGAPKYDLRDWDANHEKMSKGLVLSEEELRELKKILDKEIAFLDAE